MVAIPPPNDTDAEDVVWGLQTAEALWKRGERIDALVWLRRAAQAAGEATDDDRALELARAAAELSDWMATLPQGASNAPPAPSAPPAPPAPPRYDPHNASTFVPYGDDAPPLPGASASGAPVAPSMPPGDESGSLEVDVDEDYEEIAPAPSAPHAYVAPGAPRVLPPPGRAPSSPTIQTEQPVFPDAPAPAGNDAGVSADELGEHMSSVLPAERVHAGMFNPWADGAPPPPADGAPPGPALSAPPAPVPAAVADEGVLTSVRPPAVAPPHEHALAESTGLGTSPLAAPPVEAPKPAPVKPSPPRPPPLPARARKAATAAPPAQAPAPRVTPPPPSPTQVTAPQVPASAAADLAQAESDERSVAEAMMSEATVAEAPVAEAPVAEAPVAEAPVAEAPVAEAPVAEAPVAEAPVAEAPVAEAPVAEAPVAEAPVAEAPVAEAPVAEAPVAEAPAPAPPDPATDPEPGVAAPDSEPPAPPAPAPPAKLDLEEVEAFADLPDDAREAFAAAATVSVLGEGEEVSSFALAYILSGTVDVAATMVDAPAAQLAGGAVLRSRGTTEGGVPMRLIGVNSGVVATWGDAEVNDAFRTCPWVEEDLRVAADRLQTLVGVTIGPLGERLDASIREQIIARLVMRTLTPGEVVVTAGQAVPGLLLVGVGELELVDGEAVTGVVGSGEFLFPGEVLGAGDAPRTARAGPGGALILFGDRMIAQELLVTCPPLLEVFAGM